MPGNTKKRRRKHRGTQAGSIDRRGPRGRPRNRTEAKARAQRRTQDRRDVPPTWNSAAIRGLFAAGVFLLLMLFVFGRSTSQAIGLSVFMLVFYIPLGYYTDRFFYRRRQRQRAQAKQKNGNQG